MHSGLFQAVERMGNLLDEHFRALLRAVAPRDVVSQEPRSNLPPLGDGQIFRQPANLPPPRRCPPECRGSTGPDVSLPLLCSLRLRLVALFLGPRFVGLRSEESRVGLDCLSLGV